MLMLTRQPGKSIIIGGNIRVTVAGVTGQQVRLGVVAPAGVVVDREEIHQLRVAEGTAQVSAFSVDEHVKLAADARRYRHLRDRECIEDASDDLLVLRGDTYFTGEELDREIDAALRLETSEQQVVQEEQP